MSFDEAAYARREADAKFRESVVRARQAGVPGDVLAAIDNGGVVETEATRYVEKFMAQQREVTLILGGPPGPGKTFACCAKGLFGHPGIFIRATHLARISWFDEKAWAMYERTPLLVVDDLGREYVDANGGAAAQFEAAFDVRHCEGRRTIFTTNLSAEEFGSRYGERWVDRLRQRGRYVAIGGPSMRSPAV